MKSSISRSAAWLFTKRWRIGLCFSAATATEAIAFSSQHKLVTAT